MLRQLARSLSPQGACVILILRAAPVRESEQFVKGEK